jgi:diaminohydroxyphosphoribosylaminopyrimidine deaminase/5-amino-6-(5-phosphoribosylamino)uracil reductase
VDKVLTFLAPKIVGGKDAPGMVAGTGRARMDEAWLLERLKATPIGEDIMLTGYIKK